MEAAFGGITLILLVAVWYLWQINDQLKELNRRIEHLKNDWDARGMEHDPAGDFYRDMAGMPKKE